MATNTNSAPTNASAAAASVDEFDGENIKDTDTVLKFISDMLMDDDDDDFQNEQFVPHHDLQATEKSFYDALLDQPSDSTTSIADFDASTIIQQFHNARWDPPLDTPGGAVVKKNRYREGEAFTDRSNKQPAANDRRNDEDDGLLETYDDVLLFPNSSIQSRRQPRKSKNKWAPPRGEDLEEKEYVDLSSLLMQCAQAVERFNSKAVMDLMFQIRKHSSPRGTALERVAHYFANGLEARLSGTGRAHLASLNSRWAPSRAVLKAYRMFISSCPYMTMSNLFAKSALTKLADGAATLHVIDFGILYGFQWPCLIQALSERPNGPPKLRITGIDNPLPGFRPAERVLHTGRQLARYCERFRVPFEYNGIAKAWDGIRIEDLDLREGEVVAVNSMYRLHNMMEKELESPRDAVLKLILKIGPALFVHGVVNGSYNMPFFVSRFKEAFFHYYAMFDMLEATVPQDEEGQMIRICFEESLFGKGAMNIIACEGTDILESPETYRRWRFRTTRAGFRQLPVEGDVVKRMKKVKSSYHPEFSVSEEDNWVLLEWKGRVIHAISCWKPACT